MKKFLFNNAATITIFLLAFGVLAADLHYSDGLFGSGGGVVPPASGIASLVEDTSPQLGGDLDGQAFNITTTGDVTAENLRGDISSTTLNTMTLSGATLTTLEDFVKISMSAGKIDGGGDVTDNGDGTVAISEVSGAIRTTASDVGLLKSFTLSAQPSIGISLNENNYIYIKYNGGNLAVATTSVRSDINGWDEVALGIAYNDGSLIHVITGGVQVHDLGKRTHQRAEEMDGFKRSSGLVISETGTRGIAMSEGVYWRGNTRFPAVASTTITFSTWYNDGAWQETSGQTQISNTQYNDFGTGLDTVSPNQYGVHFVYMHHELDYHVVYGIDSYTLAGAQAVGTPASLPDVVSSFSVPLAKIIVKKDATNFQSVHTLFENAIGTSIVTDHAGLNNLAWSLAGHTFDTALDIGAYNFLTTGGVYASSTSIFGDNVGIGTDNPGAKLDVVETTAAGVELKIQAGEGSASQIQLYADDGDDNVDKWHGTVSAFTGNFGWTNQALAGTSLDLQGGGDVILAGGSGGNVGIGTTTPNATLNVHTADGGDMVPNVNADDLVIENSGSGGLTILTPDANDSNIYFGSPTHGAGAFVRWNWDAALMDIRTQQAGAGMAFKTGNGAEAMFIDGDQNVGIGTTSPNSKLHVSEGYSGAVCSAEICAEDDGPASIQIVAPTNQPTRLFMGDDTNLASLNFQWDANASPAASIQTFVANADLLIGAGNDNSDQLWLDGNGNIGIATTSPASLLDLFSTGTTTQTWDSDSASQGGCLKMKDISGVGYTYLTVEDGVLTASQISCE